MSLTLAEVMVKVGIDRASLNAGLDEAKSTITSKMKSAEESSKMLLGGLAVAGAGILAFGAKSVQTAANMSALNAQFEQVFGNISSTATNSLNQIAEETGMLPNRLKGSFVRISAFAKTTGLDTADALALTERATRAAADSAAFYDKSIEEVSETMQSYLKGNYENDAALGISSTETTRNAMANKLYGQSFIDLSEAQKQLTLLAMVEEGNKLTGALGQAARESDSFENQLGNLKQSFSDFLVVVGQPLLEPVINALKSVSKHITAFKDIVEDKGFKGALEQLIPDGLEMAIVVVAGAIVAAIIPALVGMAIAAWAAMAPLLPFMAAGAAIAALAYLIYKGWEPLSQFFTNLWTGISSTVTGIWNTIKSTAESVWNGIKYFFKKWGDELLLLVAGPAGWAVLLVVKIVENWVKIKEATSKVWETIAFFLSEKWKAISNTFSNVGNSIKSFLTGLWNGISSQVNSIWSTIHSTISNKVSAISNTISNVGSTIRNVFSNLANSAYQWGSNLIGEFLRGFRSKIASIKSAANEVASSVSRVIGFRSPAKEGPGADADKWGPNLITMFAQGLRQGVPMIENTVLGVSNVLSLLGVMPDTSVAGAAAAGNTLISGNTFYIREEADIDKVAEKLAKKQRDYNRGRGVKS